MKQILIVVAAVLLGGLAVFVFLQVSGNSIVVTREDDVPAGLRDDLDTNEPEVAVDTTEEEEEAPEPVVDDSEVVIGTSVDGRDITAYNYGEGDTNLLFIGGIHGGYSWNTSLVTYELMDHLEENPEIIPEDVKVTVIPVLNPDGLQEVVGTTDRFAASEAPTAENTRIPGRFNANDVDLNRNFDCEWQSTGTWRNREVDGGSSPFSEPESAALRDYIATNEPDTVIAYYSAAGGVFSSSCRNGVSDKTRILTNAYADAAGYDAFEEFDFYEVTGDMVNWFAKIDIPAISVLLTTHTDVEWSKNRAGIEAVLKEYAE